MLVCKFEKVKSYENFIYKCQSHCVINSILNINLTSLIDLLSDDLIKKALDAKKEF